MRLVRLAVGLGLPINGVPFRPSSSQLWYVVKVTCLTLPVLIPFRLLDSRHLGWNSMGR